MDSRLLYSLFHVTFVAPLLLYVGLKGTKTPTWLFTLLAILVVGMVAYHGWRAYQKLADGRSAWINWIHLLLVAPVLGWIALRQKETPRRAFEMTMLLGFAALGYHGYYLVTGSA